MYDPLFSQLEIAVLSALGVVVLRENEVRGKAAGSVSPAWTCVVLSEEARGRQQRVRDSRRAAADCDQGGGVAAGGEEGAASAPREALLLGVLCPWAGRLQPSPGWVVAESSDGGGL